MQETVDGRKKSINMMKKMNVRKLFHLINDFFLKKVQYMSNFLLEQFEYQPTCRIFCNFFCKCTKMYVHVLKCMQMYESVCKFIKIS